MIGGRRALVASVIVLVGLLTSVALFGLAEGSAAPVLQTTITANDYQSVLLTFNEQVYQLESDGDHVAGDPPLTPDNFTLTGAPGITISAVTAEPGAQRAAWRLTFSAPVVPHDAVIAPVPGAIGNSEGALAFTQPVPFSTADLTGLVATVKDLALLPTNLSLPFMQDWLGGGRDLGDVVPGIAALDAIPTTEAALVAAIEALPGVAGVTFDAYNATLAFDDATTAHTETMDGSFALTEFGGVAYDLALDGSVAVDIAIGGNVRLDLQHAATVIPTTATPSIRLSASAPFSPSGRIGIVEATATANLDVDALFTLTTVPSDPTTAPDVAITGTAILNLTQVEVASLPAFTGTPLLGIRWTDLGMLERCSDGTAPAAGTDYCAEPAPSDPDALCPDGAARQSGECRVAPTPNIVIDHDLFDPLSLRNFTRASVHDLLSGLDWFAGWLALVETHGHAGADLPVIGGSLGSLADLSESLKDPVLALKDIAALKGSLSDHGDLSADALHDVCTMSTTELEALIAEYATLNALNASLTENLTTHLTSGLALCNNVLSAATIATDTVEFQVQVTNTYDAFDGVTPQLDLGMGDDLAGVALSANLGTWTADTTTAFTLTFGVRLGSDSALGITPTENPLGKRFYVRAGDVATSDLAITGNDVAFGGRLGVLDFRATGDIQLDPRLYVNLTDTDDGLLTLRELHQAANTSDLASVLEVDLGGAIDATFTLENDVVFASDRTIQLAGPLKAIDQPFAVHSDVAPAWPYQNDRINIGHDLGDALNLKDLTATQIIQMIVQVAQGIADMDDSPLMATSIPFVDVRFGEALDFAADFGEIATRVQQAAPQDITSLQAALDDALGAVGMSDAVTVAVTADELTLAFDADRSITRSYPFSFSFDDLAIAPADGGASMTATGVMEFAPTVGILFNDTLPFDQRLFLRGAGPQFELTVDASIFGTAYLGPVQAGLQGNVLIGTPTTPASLAVTLTPPDASGRITLSALQGAIGGSGGGLFDVTYGGSLSADFDVSAGLISGNVHVTGDIADLANLTVTHALDLTQLELDLETMVYGSIELSRFIGRLLEDSGVVTQDLPFVGDALRSATTLGQDVQSVADTLDAAWQAANGGPSLSSTSDTFLDTVETQLQNALCGGANCVHVTLFPAGATTLAEAEAVEIRLDLLRQTTGSLGTLSEGLDLAPVFALDFDVTPSGTLGYHLDLVLGLSLEDGFYVRGGSDTTDLLQLFAAFHTTVNAEGTLLGVDADIAGGTAQMGGNLQGGTAGGFAVDLNGMLRLNDISNRHRSIDEILSPRFDAEISAHLPVTFDASDIVLEVPVNLHVGVSGGAPAFTLALGCDPDVLPEACDAEERIMLDLSSVVDGVVRPVVHALSAFDPANGQFNPLAQEFLVELLETEIAVLDRNVSALMDEFAAAMGYENEWAVVKFLIQIGGVEVDEINGQLDLGWLEVYPTFTHHDPAVPVQMQPSYGPVQSLIDSFGPGPAPSGDGAVALASSDPLLRFPILEDPAGAIFLLVGGEHAGVVTFAEFAPPKLEFGPKIGFDEELEMNIAFIEGKLRVALDIFFGGVMNTGFGYDSSGLRTGIMTDGFFLIDREGNEVGFEGRVSVLVDGKFSIVGIASVHLRGSGGVFAAAGLDLFDESIALPTWSRGDGRLNLHEIKTIAEAYDPPVSSVPESSFLCMFQLGIDLNAHLSFSGKLKVFGATVWSGGFNENWVIVDEDISCSLAQKAAHVNDRQLILNGGTFADRRFDGTTDLDEHFTVTQSGDEISVTVTTYPLVGGPQVNLITTTFETSRFDSIYAELGAGGDEVTIDPSVTLPAVLRGGDGNDILTGGSGNDEILGEGGEDVLKGMAGDDALEGGSGDDELWAGAGDDLLTGGAGQNTYVVDDAWDTAEVVDSAATGVLDIRTTAGVDGTASFFEGTVTDGSSTLEYGVDEIMEILGGPAADTFTVNRYAPDGFRIDGRGANDTVNVPFSGVDRRIFVDDSSGQAHLIGTGTAAPDTMLFRGRCDGGAGCLTDSGAADIGFVALKTPSGAVDRVDYTKRVSLVTFNGGGGNDLFVLDDTATRLVVNGDEGDDNFQVGQIFGNPRAPPFVAAGDEVRTRGVEARGPMSLGVSHPAVLNGSVGDDWFQVYSNIAPLKLEGAEHDDTFVLRAFILEGSVTSAGGDGHDVFEYVQNALVTIDGGTGFNTLILIGTELSDGFVVEVDGGATRASICPQLAPGDIPDWAPVDRMPNATGGDCAINTIFVNIHAVVMHGLRGNDAFWVRSSLDDYHMRLFGGEDGATFLVGDEGDLTGIQGPIDINGEYDPGFDASVPDPVVLPGEDDTPGGQGLNVTYDDQENELVIHASAHTTDDVGNLTPGRIHGLGMGGDTTIGGRALPGGITYALIDELTILLGSGDDDFTIEGTQIGVKKEPIEPGSLIRENVTIVTETILRTGGGHDDVAVRALSGHTTVDLGAGDDGLLVGSSVTPGATAPDGVSNATGIGDTLHVLGRAGDDELIVDGSGSEYAGAGVRVDVDPGVVTELLMPGMITHTTSTDGLAIHLPGGHDTANVRGTSIPTTIYGHAGDDRAFVSTHAVLGADEATPPYLEGALVDVDAELAFDAGNGTNLLMVSDRNGTAGLAGAVLDHDRLTGFASADIVYEASGTFAGGVTIWTGAHADDVSVIGTRLDGDPTTLLWEGRPDGVDARTVTTLNTGAGADQIDVGLHSGDGFFVVNAQDGDDNLDGAASTLGFMAFGGLGNDGLTTGSGDDVVFGDEGRIEYCTGPALVLEPHGGVDDCGAGLRTLVGDADVANMNDGMARRPARMYALEGAVSPSDGQPFAVDLLAGPVWPSGFNNRIQVGAGDDVAWGGPGSDLVQATAGVNAMMGDGGEAWRFHPSELGGTRTVTTNDPFIDDQVLTGAIAFIVDVPPEPVAPAADDTDDVIVGGSGQDWVFAGARADLVYGASGPDILFGDDGHDTMWGGEGDDRMYGGADADVIDVKRSSYDAGITAPVTDPEWWELAWYLAPDVDTDALAATDNGNDITYGGRERDILQADRGAGGPGPGDRLADWFGSFNLYLVCDGHYGAGKVLRKTDPDIELAFLRLAEADGAYDVFDKSSSGWRQLALVVDEHASANRGAPHPDHPGNHAGC